MLAAIFVLIASDHVFQNAFALRTSEDTDVAGTVKKSFSPAPPPGFSPGGQPLMGASGPSSAGGGGPAAGGSAMWCKETTDASCAGGGMFTADVFAPHGSKFKRLKSEVTFGPIAGWCCFPQLCASMTAAEDCPKMYMKKEDGKLYEEAGQPCKGGNPLMEGAEPSPDC